MNRPETSKPKLSVLIVEDDVFSRALVSEALKGMHGYIIERHLVGDCAQALASFNIKKPDIALVDIGLPDGDGFSLLSAFKEKKPECWVAMLTASHKETDVKRALKMGAADYIVKPFNAKRIQKFISSYVVHKKIPPIALPN